MAFYRFREAVIGVKAETSPGSTATIAATDCNFLAYDVSVETSREISSRSPIRDSLSPVISAGKVSATASFRAEFVTSGNEPTTGTLPGTAVALSLCGLIPNTGGTDGVFEPGIPGEQDDQDDDIETLGSVTTGTIAIWHEGQRIQLKGCLGSVSLSCTHGEPIMLDFTFVGVMDGHSTTAAPTGIVYSGSAPSVMGGAGTSFEIGGVAGALTSFNLDFNTEVALPTDGTSTTGLPSGAYAMPMGRTVSGSCDPLMDAHDTRNDIANLTAGTAQEIKLVLGNVSGNTWNMVTLKANDALLSKVSTSESDGAVRMSIDFSVGSLAGDTEIDLTISDPAD